MICPKGRGHTADHEVLEGIEIFRHSLPTEARGVLGFVSEYATALFHEMRLACHVWRKHRFDVVHVANPPDLLFLVSLPFKLFGAKLIFDHHDLTPELYREKFGTQGLGYWLMRISERLTFHFADTVISTNESYKAIAMDRGGKHEDDIFVVRSSPNSTNMRQIAADETIRNKAGIILGYVGIMGSQDGIDVLLDILATLRDRFGFQDFHAVLIGDGPELQASRQRAVELGLAEHVTFTGYLSGENLHRALSSIDIGLCPDPYNDYTRRCTMNKIMEYMAFAKPIVQFDLDEGRFSAQDASLYARIGDRDHFAELIRDLANDAEKRSHLGAIGRKRIEQTLNWAVEAPKLLAAYARALPGKIPAKSRVEQHSHS